MVTSRAGGRNGIDRPVWNLEVLAFDLKQRRLPGSLTHCRPFARSFVGRAGIWDRVDLSLASAELGRCAEIHFWTPTSADDQRAFTAALDRMRGAIDLAALPCAIAPVPQK